MKELILKKCNSCNALVKVIQDCHCPCDISCCDEKMTIMEVNSTDASFEKHVPTYEIKDNNLIVKVNHVMEEKHLIKWLMFLTENKETTVYFKPGKPAEAIFPYEKGTLYAYCNEHGLWKCNVD